jgi:hypothetical protein
MNSILSAQTSHDTPESPRTRSCLGTKATSALVLSFCKQSSQVEKVKRGHGGSESVSIFFNSCCVSGTFLFKSPRGLGSNIEDAQK